MASQTSTTNLRCVAVLPCELREDKGVADFNETLSDKRMGATSTIAETDHDDNDDDDNDDDEDDDNDDAAIWASTQAQVMEMQRGEYCILKNGDATTENHETSNRASSSACWQCTFSRDGRFLAACFGAPEVAVRIWEHHSSAATHAVEEEAGGDVGGHSWQWVATLKDPEVHNRTIRALSFAPMKYMLATASFDGTVAIWEKFPSDKTGGRYCWDCTVQLEGHENEVKDVQWNHTGTLLATCGRDKSVWIWECLNSSAMLLAKSATAEDSDEDDDDEATPELECLAVLNGHEGDVKCIRFAPSNNCWGDGDEILLSASYDDTIKCWAEDAGDWYCAATLSSMSFSSTVWTLSLEKTGLRMISGAADGSVSIWQCSVKNKNDDQARQSSDANWSCVARLPSAHGNMPVYSVDLSSSLRHRRGIAGGRLASGGGDNRILVYREVDPCPDRPLFAVDAWASIAHADVNCVAWHPLDDSLLASASDDGLVRLWKYTPSTMGTTRTRTTNGTS